ncbi:pyruvate carboxylase subunit B [Lacrimispora sp. 210928-DFI.3.58]|uniref:pyruvate carboxylase subunit B n=1 Tax=Lacrimispora sp. 210928-DFI.3.58 TaxID=2883214 RepID=UPI001D06F184|nr:pyruvate carboxylase subunit B [Lacrimispora sp. 210928-DFI.3.58]MCB7319103.1 pyruvate carboxylase subunit B [Lacrimispora sp. 210928-DFI.3.58]
MLFSKRHAPSIKSPLDPGAPRKKLWVVSLELRDGQQSLLGTRLRTEDILPVLPLMDEVGYECIEMWGGATFEVALRFLEEDPWERLRAVKQRCKKTPLRMLLRGQNLVGCHHYPDDIVVKFVECAARNGIDYFMVMDGLNDVRNTEVAVQTALSCGKKAIASIPFMLSPVHTTEKFVEIAREYEKLGVYAVELEDMAGMISPLKTGETIRALKAALKIPVYYQAHSTGGMADLGYWEAIRAGADAINCDVSALARGTSHPAAESFVAALQNTPLDTGLDLDLLGKINDHFLALREKYKEYESKFAGVNVGVLKHKIPGGMLSNLELQLKQMNAESRMEELFEEVARVSRDFGYPPMATPFSQMIGAQAMMNLCTGQRYKIISNECRNYIRGSYGRPAGPISEELKAEVLKGQPAITERPGSLLAPGWEEAKEKSAAFARCDEDVLTYALFPAYAENVLKKKYHLL